MCFLKSTHGSSIPQLTIYVTTVLLDSSTTLYNDTNLVVLDRFFILLQGILQFALKFITLSLLNKL